MLSNLDHPNIVRYVGTMREGSSLLIFLEYVPVSACVHGVSYTMSLQGSQ